MLDDDSGPGSSSSGLNTGRGGGGPQDVNVKPAVCPAATPLLFRTSPKRGSPVAMFACWVLVVRFPLAWCQVPSAICMFFGEVFFKALARF